jgi:hypothetical protein
MQMEIRQEAVKAIRHSYAVLSAEQNLSPQNERVNHSLTHLVRTLTRCQAPEVSAYLLATPDLSVERENLPGLCGQAECEMEKFWARKLISRTDSHLNEFWYYPEYQELCRAEKELFDRRSFGTISFLGAGALPLTAFLLAHSVPAAKIVCVDYDSEACDLAQQLGKRLGLESRVDIRCMDALTYDPQDNELVICASLLQGREEVYRRLLKHHQGALMVRDSEGAYQFLYKAAELPKTGFREIAKTAMDPRRINTTRYYEPEAVHDRAA